MRILLVCTLGVSTSLLVRNMQKVSPEDFIEAQSVGDLEFNIDNFDVVLAGPQISFKYKKVEEFCKSKNKPCGLIPPTVYGRFDGEAAMKQVRELMEANK